MQDQWFESENTGKNDEHQESVVDDPPSENDKEEPEDPLSNCRSANVESCLQHQNGVFPAAREATLNAIVNIAPGQNQRRISLMSGQFCEELSFPTLFLSGKFGFNTDRDVPLSVIKYENSPLLNHTGRFASNPGYLFFMQYVIEQKKVADSISIARRKIQGQGIW